ncbi:unnamed protein product [Phaedon cochleariae]|uniref:Dynein axonemal light chain 1 n=1 Tax=Phaedon cochleariae TaxID=80249 RepID=A0A9P0GS53_PHACE|nr:unnamed protein product [Phaedon cochleariae]
MSKPTTIKDAIKRWEEKHPGESISEATDVGFQFQWPPIEKMDNSLSALTKCRKLSLSTNMIEKISGISALKNLKILSLGRNYIKSFSGLEGVADTLEELWISYNVIEKVKGVGVLKKLKVLYIGNNMIKEWGIIYFNMHMLFRNTLYLDKYCSNLESLLLAAFHICNPHCTSIVFVIIVLPIVICT